MGRLDRLADVLEEPQSRLDGEPVAVAVVRDGLALHEVHRQPGAPVRGDAAVEQPRDGRVVEPGQDLALGDEPRRALRRQARAHQFDGGRLLVRSVGSLGAPDFAHAPSADALDQSPRADPVDRFGQGAGRRREVEEGLRAGVGVEQGLDLGPEGIVGGTVGRAAGAIEGSLPLGLGEVGDLLEEGFEAAPAVHGIGHRALGGKRAGTSPTGDGAAGCRQTYASAAARGIRARGRGAPAARATRAARRQGT